MIYHIAGQVTFSTTKDRNQAQRVVDNELVNAGFTKVFSNSVTLNGSPALDMEYTHTDQATVLATYDRVYNDINTNSYLDILGLSLWAAS